MSGIIVSGDTSGSVTLSAPAVAGTVTVTLPSTSGTMAVTGASQSFTNITATGTIQGASTIGVGNATPAASGAGITFPATQSASSDVNTLDDYEEGTWTPILTPATGTITAQTCSGSYVKIGKQVTLTFQMLLVSGTITMISQMTNLPFTSASANAPMGVARETQATGTMWEMVMNNSATVVSMFAYNNSSVVANSYGWIGSVTYFTA